MIKLILYFIEYTDRGAHIHTNNIVNFVQDKLHKSLNQYKISVF